MQWTQYAVDAVLTQWTQWMQWNSGIWYHYSTASTVHCILHLLCTVFTVSTVYCIHFVTPLNPLVWPLTMSPPPYTTIPLHPLHTASTGLTLLHQRQCPNNHIPLFHCIHYILRPLCTASTGSTGLTFCTKDNVPTTIYHYSTAYCIHCILCPLRTASTPSSHFCVILTQPDYVIWSNFRMINTNVS